MKSCKMSKSPVGLNKLLIQVARTAKVRMSDVKGSCRRNSLVAVRVLFAKMAIERGYSPEDIAGILCRYPSVINHYYKNFTPSKEYINLKERYENAVK